MSRPGVVSILLVEDDQDSRELYRLILKASGFEVHAVDDGLAALRLLEYKRPSLIVLDLALPFLDGREVAAEVAAHADTRHIPIVIITAARDPKVAGNVRCVLRKPIDPYVLVEKVHECLSLHRGGA